MSSNESSGIFSNPPDSGSDQYNRNFVDYTKLRRFLSSERYINDFNGIRKAFQSNGVFVTGQSRFEMTEFLPSLFLSPSTIDRLLELIPPHRPLYVSGMVLRRVSSEAPLALAEFQDVLVQNQGELVPHEDQITFGPTIGDPQPLGAIIKGELSYDWVSPSRNPFDPERVKFSYYARAAGAIIDVFLISDRDRDLFKLREALSWLGKQEGEWEVISADRGIFPTTDLRHAFLENVAWELNSSRNLVPRGLIHYEGRFAEDLGPATGDEFDRSHTVRQGIVNVVPLSEAIRSLKDKKFYLAMADMLYSARTSKGGMAMFRIELYIKLKHRRVDISVVDARLLKAGLSDGSVMKIEDYNALPRVNITRRGEILADLWMTISPIIFRDIIGSEMPINTPSIPEAWAPLTGIPTKISSVKGTGHHGDKKKPKKQLAAS